MSRSGVVCRSTACWGLTVSLFVSLVAWAADGQLCVFPTDGVCPAACWNSSCPVAMTGPFTCPPDSFTNTTGAAWPWDCACDTGRFGLPRCDLCPLNSYCPANASSPVPCPQSLLGVDAALQFSTSQLGSASVDACQCPYFATRVEMRCVRCVPASYIVNNTCVPCPVGFFCPGDGLAWPCSRWSECPAGTAGVGLKCANESFFEPHVEPSANGTRAAMNVTATADGAWAVDGVRIWWNNTWYGGAESGCDDGALGGSFGSITDLVVVRGVLWIADPGCRAVRALSRAGLLTTALGNVTSRALALLPNGLLLASDERSGGCIWAINPSTRFSNPMVCGMGRILGLAVIPREPFIILAATDAYNVSFLSSNFTLVDSVFTPTLPLRIAFADTVVYGDGQLVYQLSSGGEWVNLMGLDVGPRLFPFVGIGEFFVSMEWNNSALLLGTPTRLVPLSLCNPCPPNSTTFYSLATTPGLSRCQCSGGLYMSGGCQQCPAGAYCPRGAVDPIPCPTGSWCGAGVSEPTACDPSVYCAAGSVDAFGQVPGRPGGPLCTIGYYRSSAACVACPSLSSTLDNRATSVVECVCATTAVDGRTLFTFLNATAGRCHVCPATRYCPLGTVLPLECPPGTFCRAGVEAPQTCPVGFYCPGGLPDPVSCEPGTFCDMGSSSKATCRARYYCPREATNELPCPVGQYCPTASGAPLSCPAGSYCVGNVSAPEVCPVGTWCAAGVSASMPCPETSTSLSNARALEDCFCVSSFYGPGGLRCFSCPTGGYSPPGSINLTDCVCDTGFRLSPDVTACLACGAGEYCPGGVARTCPPGYVCTARSAGPCLAGFYCPVNTIVGLSDPVPCPPGGLCVAGAASPVNCSAGYFCPGRTAVALQCPGGTFCPAASSAPIVCRAGVQCAPGSVLDSVPCSAGRFCPRGTAVGILCYAGAFCPAAASAPVVCSPGSFCARGAAAATACPRASFCPEGAANYTVCPGGYVCPLVGMAVPVPCPVGFWCPPGATEATPCPNGTTSPNASEASAACVCGLGHAPSFVGGDGAVQGGVCTVCAAGSYKDVEGDIPCVACDGAPEGAIECLPLYGFPLWIAVSGAAGAVVLVGASATLYYTMIAPLAVMGAPQMAAEVGHAKNVFANVRIAHLRRE